jgi:hypothetical protein
MKKPILLLSGIIFIILSLSIVQVSVANSMSTTGVELSQLQKELAKYEKENKLLEERYLEAASLTNLDKQAKKIGFVESKSQEYLSTPLPLALNQ